MTDPAAVNLRVYRVLRATVAVCLTAVIVLGFVRDVPRLDILEHTARNLYFHVPMWFTMMAAAIVSAFHSLRFLKTGHIGYDIRAREAAVVAVVFGVLGLVTGIFWSRWTWYESAGIWWNFDPKQSMAAVELLIYGAYFVLRSSMEEPEKRARIGAVYNVFAFLTVPFLLYVLPRQMESLHPGAEGSPAFSQTDLAPAMQPIFYAAVLGFIGLFWVLYTQRVRLARLKQRLDELDLPEL